MSAVQQTLTGWCTRCGGECFDEVRHVCRKPMEDAAAMIAMKRENERLRAALESLTKDPPATLDGPDPDWEVITKMRAIARAALEQITELK